LRKYIITSRSGKVNNKQYPWRKVWCPCARYTQRHSSWNIQQLQYDD